MTLLFGILWFIIAGIITGFIFDGQVPHYLLWVLLLTPVMFYFYNLLKVYHAIYTAEKIKCWERLKE
jgi:ABC-type multidrug transport system permease subunit